MLQELRILRLGPNPRFVDLALGCEGLRGSSSGAQRLGELKACLRGFGIWTKPTRTDEGHTVPQPVRGESPYSLCMEG